MYAHKSLAPCDFAPAINVQAYLSMEITFPFFLYPSPLPRPFALFHHLPRFVSFAFRADETILDRETKNQQKIIRYGEIYFFYSLTILVCNIVCDINRM